MADGKVIVVFWTNEPITKLQHHRALGSVAPVVARPPMLGLEEQNAVMANKELADTSCNLADHKMVAISLTDEPVTQTNVCAGLPMVPPIVWRTSHSVSAENNGVFAKQELWKIVVVVTRVVDDNVPMAAVSYVPAPKLKADPVGLASNSVTLPVDTKCLTILVVITRPSMAPTITSILQSPAPVRSTSVKVCTRNLINGDPIMHVVVRVRKVPMLICPGLPTIMFVVGMIKHRNHIVRLTSCVHIDTIGHAPERYTHQCFASNPHRFTCTVGVAISVLFGDAPAVRATSIVQGPCPVGCVKESSLNLVERNLISAIMSRVGKVPPSCDENAIAITVV